MVTVTGHHVTNLSLFITARHRSSPFAILVTVTKIIYFWLPSPVTAHHHFCERHHFGDRHQKIFFVQLVTITGHRSSPFW